MKNRPPRFLYKQAIRDTLIDALFKKTREIALAELSKIIKRNCAMMGYSHQSFAYHGQFYTLEFIAGPPVRQRLHPDLVEGMQTYLEEFGHPLKMEMAIVEGYINSMLASSALPGDYLLLLPAALHDGVKTSVSCDWSTSLSPEKIAAFQAKYAVGYKALRTRMALNLIL